MGPRIYLCGIPLVMGNGSEIWWPNFTFCVLLERYDVNHLQEEGENPYNLSFIRRI